MIERKTYNIIPVISHDNCFIVTDKEGKIIGRVLKKDDGFYILGIMTSSPYKDLAAAARRCLGFDVQIILAPYHTFVTKCESCGENHYEHE